MTLYLPQHIAFLTNRAWFYYNGDESAKTAVQSVIESPTGAVLVQNTSWKNVERAIANLRDAGLLEPCQLFELPVQELQELIRPAGYFRIKTKRLRNLLRLLVEQYAGSTEAMFASDPERLREQLASGLQLRGTLSELCAGAH